MKDFVNSIREEIASIWKLLNDTTIFLTRIKKFNEYEKQIKEWRDKLQRFLNNPDIRKEIRQSIIYLRNYFRSQGYDLKLGSKDVGVFGFKSDDAPLHGFKRIVIVIDNDNIFYITGEDNHQDLMRFLALRLKVESIFYFKNVHSLWFRWHNNVLQFCGADSESKEDLEKFKKFIENNKGLVLKKMKNLY